MTLAKGLTSGYVPMGATMLSEQVYAGIADGAPAGVPIGHGATYSAHPVGAAVALEVLRLYEEGGVLANAQRVAPLFAAGLDALRAAPAGRRCAPSRPARRAGTGERQGRRSAASIPRSACPTASSRPPTATASCSAASATASSASRRR